MLNGSVSELSDKLVVSRLLTNHISARGTAIQAENRLMQTVLLVVHLLIALALIGVVLLQRSEGGALGIGGGGGAGNLFSARGVGNALTRTTAILAVAFFVTSIALTVMSSRGGVGGSAFDTVAPTEKTPTLPKLDDKPATPQVPVQQ
jgi:preprotein translocase subunit SecG